jgi:hypothetical protein
MAIFHRYGRIDVELLTYFLVTTLTEREDTLLLAVAPHVKAGYKADNFIEELYRLADQDPVRVSNVLGKVLGEYGPDYDYEDYLKKLLIKLVESGQLEEVLIYADRLRKLPGIDHLFKQLTERGKSPETY